MKIALDSVGCKLNQAELQLLARQFAGAGHTIVSPDENADIYILNTCTVTHVADRKSRHMLRMAHRHNPETKLIVTGCYAHRVPQELSEIEGVDLVLDNAQKPHLLKILEESGVLSRPEVLQTQPPFHEGRTRAFIKAQDGCNWSCAYCIIPLVRGREKSVPADEVVAEVRKRISDGCKETVLTGTELGAYNNNGIDLKGLLERILAETDVTRLRLSSIQPQEVSAELIDLWLDPRLCRHFHISLQSGSDSVLRRMNRRYSIEQYQQAVTLIRSKLPEAAITTDIIVGFPGETEAEFKESHEFCRQMEFARIHVFPYSPRPGTLAARMSAQIKDNVKKQRSEKMLALAEESARNFRRRFLGKTMPVLWEKHSEGVWSGLTDNYIKVYTRSEADLTNKLMPAKLMELWEDGVSSRL